jgi:hypothetical protein
MYDRCRHIRVDGARCRAMAIQDRAFCYFHMCNRRSKPAKPAKTITADYGLVPVNPPAAQIPLNVELPLLEDRYAIQIGITQIVRALAANEIDPKRAGLLLYALQIASSNLRQERYIGPENVRNVVLTRDGDQIAPAQTVFEDQDISTATRRIAGATTAPSTQTDNEAHHPDCACGNCESSVADEAPEPEDTGEETPEAEIQVSA